MRRREVVAGIASAATIWPAVVRAQQMAVRKIGVLTSHSASSVERYFAALREGLA